MTDPPLLIPNIAAEEGPGWKRQREQPAVRSVVSSWRLLFEADSQILDERDTETWPRELGAPATAPVFAWLDARGAATAWLNTSEAAQVAADHGRKLSGPAPGVVARIHDKAFACEVAFREGRVPPLLRECSFVFEPSDLTAPDAPARIEAALACWPAWARQRFTLKPRFGSSGRGRVAGRDGRADDPALVAALPRLAGCGGALLEPWLERVEDLSAQMYLDPTGGVTLLGTTRPVLAPSGVYRGQRGYLGDKGRIVSGSDYDEDLREAAVAVAAAARERGFWGPCGLDAFSFRDTRGTTHLRPVVEFNARFTLGIVAIGITRRALSQIRQKIGLSPGERRPFFFGLDTPPGGWPAEASSPEHLLIRLTEPGGASRPGLLVASDGSALDRLLASSRDETREPASRLNDRSG